MQVQAFVRIDVDADACLSSMESLNRRGKRRHDQGPGVGGLTLTAGAGAKDKKAMNQKRRRRRTVGEHEPAMNASIDLRSATPFGAALAEQQKLPAVGVSARRSRR